MKWQLKLAALALGAILLWGLVHIYRSYVLALDDAERAEARREALQDSIRIVFEEQQAEIDAAQSRIVELTVLTVEIKKDLVIAQRVVDVTVDEVEAALPPEERHLAVRLRKEFSDERLVWAKLDVTKDSTLLEKDRVIGAQGEMLMLDSVLIAALTEEAEKYKKAAGSTFKFGLGSSLVTGLIGIAVGATIVAVAGS